MELIEVPAELMEKHPHAGLYEVVGRCMEPLVMEGERVLVDAAEPLGPGRVAVVRMPCRAMPRLCIVDALGPGGLVDAHDQQGGVLRFLARDVLGVVVAVVADT